MKVGELRKVLDQLPDDAPVLRSGGDHEYYTVTAVSGTALWDRQGHIWNEDHGEEFTPEAEYGKRVPALLI